MYLSCILVIVILFLVAYYLSIENFNLGIGKSFSNYYNPQSCEIDNNCFKGAYFRSQLYNNMCEPQNSNLLREKKPLKDFCLRTLGNHISKNLYFTNILD